MPDDDAKVIAAAPDMLKLLMKAWDAYQQCAPCPGCNRRLIINSGKTPGEHAPGCELETVLRKAGAIA
jgi:hypothetical protein